MCQQGTIHGALHFDGFSLELGSKSDRSPANQLSYGAAGIDRVECAVGSEGGVADVLQKAADAPRIEIDTDHVALAVEREDETLLRVGTNRPLERRQPFG